MYIIRKIINVLEKPRKLLLIPIRTFGRFLPRKTFLKWDYFACTGRKLDWENLINIDDKIQKLKLDYPDYELWKFVDKAEAKKYAKALIGAEYIIKTIGIYDNFDEIDFKLLPKRFVIKCTHDSGSAIVCTNKDNFDIKKAKKKINKCLKQNFYYKHLEYVYRDIKPRIIIEEYIEGLSSESQPVDYKFFVYNGHVQYIFCVVGRESGNPYYNYYDRNFNFIEGDYIKKSNKNAIKKPNNLDEMIEIAEKLSLDYPFIRIDLYSANNKIYFGEWTFLHNAGLTSFEKYNGSKISELLGNPINFADFEKRKTFWK